MDKIGSKEGDYIAYFQNHGVLRKEMPCPYCGKKCKLVLQPLFAFRCQKSRRVNGVRNKCNFVRSLKTNTWLNLTHLSYEKIIKFITIWLTVPYPRQDYIVETLGLSTETVVDWSNSCREICIDSVLSSDVGIIGGPGITVEVDVAKIKKRKNDKGREDVGSWIFGAIERDSSRCFFEKIQDRSASTLMDVMFRRIAPCTTIVSDQWRDDDPQSNHRQYEQLMVNHSINFIDPTTTTHTQNIERKWREIRSGIPRYGRKKNHNAGYLAEYYWKTKYGLNDRLHQFLLEVARQYDPNKE